MSAMECGRLHDLAPELALGLLDGGERAEALAHLERCASCHADVASLTELGEQLLLLAPKAPPPARFESRVLERVRERREHRERREQARRGEPGASPGAGKAPDAASPAGSAAGGPGAAPAPEPEQEDAAAPRLRLRRLRRLGRHRRRSQRGLVAAAAVVALVVAFTGVVLAKGGGEVPQQGPHAGAGPARPEPGPRPEPEVVASVPMVVFYGESPEEVGTANVLEGSPPVVHLDLADWVAKVESWDDPPERPWSLEVMLDYGRHDQYELPDGDPTPDIQLEHGDDADSLHHVAVFDGEGEMLCWGFFG